MDSGLRPTFHDTLRLCLLPLALLGVCAPLWLHWGEPGLFLAINQACMVLPAPVWTGLSLLGNVWGVLAVTSPLLLLAPRLQWAWLCAVPFGVLFARLGKGLIESLRPAGVVDNQLFRIVGEKLELASMPSGHTLTAFAVASSLYFALDAPRRRRFVWLWLLAATVGLSRIAVGAHWPGDVVVGACLGVIAGLLGHVLWRRLGAAYWNPQGWRLRGRAVCPGCVRQSTARRWQKTWPSRARKPWRDLPARTVFRQIGCRRWRGWQSSRWGAHLPCASPAQPGVRAPLLTKRRCNERLSSLGAIPSPRHAAPGPLQ